MSKHRGHPLVGALRAGGNGWLGVRRTPGSANIASRFRCLPFNAPAPGRNGERDFHNEKRSNETHASTTDPDARLYRKGSSQAAKLSYMGHALKENRHGLVVGATLTPGTGTAEREAAIKMIVRRSPGA